MVWYSFFFAAEAAGGGGDGAAGGGGGGGSDISSFTLTVEKSPRPHVLHHFTEAKDSQYHSAPNCSPDALLCYVQINTEVSTFILKSV